MKAGLALSGGGGRGFAHVGVVKVLVENDIPIDVVAGTSAGSIVGAALAAGMSPDEIDAMAGAIRWRRVTRPSLSPLGLLSNAPLGSLLRPFLPVERAEDCRLPFAAVACDPMSGEVVPLTSGDIAEAVRASCALPGIFAPVEVGGRLLVDGGVVEPLPVRQARAMGADVVIAVDLNECGATFRARPRTAAAVAIQSTMMMLRELSRAQHAAADIVIAPQVAHLRPDRIGHRAESIALGESAAREKLDEIRALFR